MVDELEKNGVNTKRARAKSAHPVHRKKILNGKQEVERIAEVKPRDSSAICVDWSLAPALR